MNEERSWYRRAIDVITFPFVGDASEHSDTRRLGAVTLISLLISSICVSFQFRLMLLALAAFFGAAVIGFIFGIPKALSQGGDPNATDGQKQVGHGVGYAPNTNLEEISDWLTKIIVGATLTQVGRVPGWVESLDQYVGQTELPSGVTGAIVILFASMGFLSSYSLTRIYLVGAFRRADETGAVLESVADQLAKSTGPAGPVDPVDDDVRDLITTDPTSAVLESWERLRSVADTAVRKAAESPSSNALTGAADEEVEPALRIAIGRLRTLRNEIAHGRARVSPFDAREYARLTKQTMARLQGPRDVGGETIFESSPAPTIHSGSRERSKCEATTKRGTRCKNWAVSGSTFCSRHG